MLRCRNLISRVLRFKTTLHSDISCTNELVIEDPIKAERKKMFKIINEDGDILKPENEPKIDNSTLVHMMKTMIKVSFIDKILYDSQRQGRISFYMQNSGEEGCQVGSSAALDKDDFVYAQYRELGVILYRNFNLQTLMDQCYSNKDDLGKGRQMPVHYGSKDLNFGTISSPLTTQLPISAGTAYAFKLMKKPNIVICYFGEGAASEGDAHAAMNFAATLKCPMIFFCRNNGYAISTSIENQYIGDGIVLRGRALGMISIRVDGNDTLACYKATQKAREIALAENRPVLIEAMTYRVGHHSTSDDSSSYRSIDEVKFWNENQNPISLFGKYLKSKDIWDDTMEKDYAKECKSEILRTFKAAEKKKKPNPLELFYDVYDKTTPRLEKQIQEMKDHLKVYGEHYDLDNYEPMEDKD